MLAWYSKRVNCSQTTEALVLLVKDKEVDGFPQVCPQAEISMVAGSEDAGKLGRDELSSACSFILLFSWEMSVKLLDAPGPDFPGCLARNKPSL